MNKLSPPGSMDSIHHAVVKKAVANIHTAKHTLTNSIMQGVIYCRAGIFSAMQKHLLL